MQVKKNNRMEQLKSEIEFFFIAQCLARLQCQVRILFTLQNVEYYNLKSLIGNPLTPKPVTLKRPPAGAGWGFGLPAVVTYKMSKLGPPKAAEVT